MMIGAFVLAIGAAFAAKETSNSLLLGYVQDSQECRLTSAPNECNAAQGTICTVSGITYYENQDPQDPTKCVDFLIKPN